MENITFSQMDQAIKDAEITIKRADYFVSLMAGIVSKRIRLLKHNELCSLKRELSKYNTKTGEWK
jgi:hypothetical protein